MKCPLALGRTLMLAAPLIALLAGSAALAAEPPRAATGKPPARRAGINE